jgi:hypothetical protein
VEGVECYRSLERSDSDENELGKSDGYFGERGGGRIGWLGNFTAAAIHIIIWCAERQRAPVFAMAPFYHRKCAANATVSDQVHGVLNPTVIFFAFISEISR